MSCTSSIYVLQFLLASPPWLSHALFCHLKWLLQVWQYTHCAKEARLIMTLTKVVLASDVVQYLYAGYTLIQTHIGLYMYIFMHIQRMIMKKPNTGTN